MNNWNRVYREDRKTFINGVLTSTAANQVLRDDVMTVSGFGTGDFVRATNGTQTHTTRQLMTGFQYHVNAAGTTKTLVVGPHPSLGPGQGTPPPSLTATEASNLDNACLDKLYKKIRGNGREGQPTTNAAVTVGESRETYRMVEGAVKAARHVSTWASKAVAKVTRKGQIVGSLADAWLSYQYGWKPLLSDIHGFAEWSTRRFRYRTFRATAQYRKPHLIITPYSNYEFITTTSTGFHESAVLYSITCSVTNESAFDLERLSSMDPKVIAWELFPLSFVLDWFVDVGSYLHGLEAASTSGLTFNRGFRTTSTLNYYDCTVRGAEKGSGQSYAWYDYCASRRIATKNRTRLTAFPRPTFPSVKVDLGVGRILSAGALLAKALGSPGFRKR